MYEAIRENFKQRAPFTEEELDEICKIIQIKKVKKRRALLSEGNIPDTVFYVNSGLLRMYAHDDLFEERTFDFACEDCWMADLHGFRTKTPATVNIDALEDSEVCVLRYADVVKIHDLFPNMQKFSRLHAEDKYIEAMMRLRKINHPNYSAEERYLDFLKKYPHLNSRISSVHLASFLGIAPETLSRVKKSLLDISL